MNMKRIKSAFEIAMEKASEIDGEMTPEEKMMARREEIKPLLARFYRGKIDAEGLWQKLKEKNVETQFQAQILLTDSLGLRTTDEQFRRRKEALLAIESLKTEQNSSTIEQVIDRIQQLQQQYEQKRKRFSDRLEQEAENSQVQMKPVQTEDGRTVMKLEPSIDEETRRQYRDAIAELETRSDAMLNQLLERLKQACRPE